MKPRPHHDGSEPAAAKSERGAILLVVLVLLAVLAMASTALTLDDSAQQQRNNEEELLFVGEQYRTAIESYMRQSPNGQHQFPVKLEDLVADHRFPQPRHHLRKLFRDPIDPRKDWALIKVGNAIVGVHSQSDAVPFRIDGFSLAQADFARASTYADWQFKVNARVAGSPYPNRPANTPGPPAKPAGLNSR